MLSLYSLTFAVQEHTIAVEAFAEVEVFVDSLDSDIGGRGDNVTVGAHETMPAAFGGVPVACGDSLAYRGVVVGEDVIVIAEIVIAFFICGIEDFASVVHELLDAVDHGGGDEFAPRGVEALGVVGEGGNDEGVANPQRAFAQGHDGVEVEREYGLLSVDSEVPESIFGHNEVVGGVYDPVSITVDETHVLARAVMDSTVPIVEDIVGAPFVTEGFVDNDLSVGAYEVDSPPPSQRQRVRWRRPKHACRWVAPQSGLRRDGNNHAVRRRCSR